MPRLAMISSRERKMAMLAAYALARNSTGVKYRVGCNKGSETPQGFR
jgi:hypothetical protein